MVVEGLSALIPSEVAMRNRLTTAGFSVTVIDDNTVKATDANGTAFVFVSSTVNGTLVGTTLRNVAQPVWMAKPSLFDDMLMTGPVADVDYGAVTSASIVITDAAHPLAAGLSGTVAVTTSSHAKSFGVPGSGADVVATASGRATTFVYQAGDPLVGGSTGGGLPPHVIGLPRTDRRTSPPPDGRCSKPLPTTRPRTARQDLRRPTRPPASISRPPPTAPPSTVWCP